MREVRWPKASALGRKLLCKGRDWALVLFGLALLMAAIGVGLMSYRNWARHAAIIWGWVGMLIALYIGFYVVPEAIDELRQICEQLLPHPGRSRVYCPERSFFRSLIVTLALAAYPFVVGTYFAMPRVRAAMKG
jgi:putative Mn2+ efflux pump MntP